MKWIPNSTTLLSAGYDDWILVSEMEDGEWKQNEELIMKHDSTVWALDYKKGVMASVSDDQTVRIWNTGT